MKQLLMCPPEFFNVSYDINPWMSTQINKVDNSLARSQWAYLLDRLSKHASIKLMDSVQDLPDLVFTANAGFISNKIAILSKFSKKERANEEIHFKNWFEKNEFTVYQPENFYEGEGDHLVDCYGRHWLGSGFRTSKNVKPELEKILNAEINVLELIDPRWYHLDTAFCPLPKGEIMWYPGAFSKDSQDIIRKSFSKHVELVEEDALMFACNCVAIGDKLFLPKNKYVSFNLTHKKYEIYEFNLNEFLKAGGAAKCLVLHCDR